MVETIVAASEAGRNDPATKADFVAVRADFAELKADFADLRQAFAAAVDRIILNQILVGAALLAAMILLSLL